MSERSLEHPESTEQNLTEFIVALAQMDKIMINDEGYSGAVKCKRIVGLGRGYSIAPPSGDNPLPQRFPGVYADILMKEFFPQYSDYESHDSFKEFLISRMFIESGIYVWGIGTHVTEERNRHKDDIQRASKHLLITLKSLRNTNPLQKSTQSEVSNIIG